MDRATIIRNRISLLESRKRENKNIIAKLYRELRRIEQQ